MDGGGGRREAAAPPPASASEPEEADSLIDTFCAIASATREEAAFFLESQNWAFDAAVRSFYDATDDVAAPPPQPSPLAAVATAVDDEEDEVGGGGGDDEDDEDYVPPGPTATEDDAAALAAAEATERRRPDKKRKRTHKPPSGGGSGTNIRTLADIGGAREAPSRSDAESDDDSDDEDWGPPPSAMLVRDHSKRSNNPDAIFEQAKRRGAVQGSPEPRQQPSSSRSFTGTGRLLTGETVQSASQQPENIVHNIYLWSNGFTVNDGPLRRFDDPANASFLESVKKSECPTELVPTDSKSQVNVNLIRREGKCPEPVKRATPFQGGGRTLGSGSSDNSLPISDVTAAASHNPSAAAPTMDDSLPSTSLQIRFADGTRKVARFNMHNTIGDVRAFIDASRPGAARNYMLQVGFPPKPLDDVTKTIEEAGVANSVITQKF